ncbi:MAG TPA: helix-turn-helix transcriptional regulator [Chloroflexota bacterium]|nr:helix-turn-helix transcriptional regulator [Chloroflexota bacterium]
MKQHTRAWELAAREGWSLREFARRVGLSHSILIDYREGRRPYSARFILGVRRLWPEYAFDWLFPQTPSPAAAPAERAG